MSLSVQVSAHRKDGRIYFEIRKSEEEMSIPLMRQILMGAVCLLIRAEDGPEAQGEAMREVIDYLHDDFANVNSFNDIKKDF